MSSREFTARFQSPVAALMGQFVQQKRACGYKYGEAARILARFDRFLCDEALPQCELPRAISRKWLAKQVHESSSTHQGRVGVVRQFAMYMCRLGYPADVPDRSLTAKGSAGFSPRILTHAEVQQLLHAVDQLTPTAHAPLRHLIMPEVFRLLYGCGFRLGEVLHLRVADVDLNQGILTVREAKFGKDRLVPPALPLVQRLQKYAAGSGASSIRRVLLSIAKWWPMESLSGLFGSTGNCCSGAGSRTPVRGKGPRVHDLRHTMPSIPCCAGAARAQTSMPSCRCWRPTWAISLLPERSAICI